MSRFGLFFAILLYQFDLDNGDLCKKKEWSYFWGKYTTRYKYCSAGCCGYYENRSCCTDVGAIIGGCIGAILFIICIVVIAIIIKKHNQRMHRNVIGTGVHVTTVNTQQVSYVQPTTQPIGPSYQPMVYGQPQPVMYGPGPHPVTPNNSYTAYPPPYPPPPPPTKY